MKRENIDWSILRGSLIIFVIAMAVSAVTCAAGYYYQQKMASEYRQAQAGFNRISNKYLQVDEQEAIIRNYYPQFVDLYQQGMIGVEKRLDWLESIQRISENLKIPGLQYEIASQQQSKVDWPFDTGRFAIYSSNMSINISMLHEIDLLRLLNRLRESNSGYFSLSDCEIQRQAVGANIELSSPNLSAECNLQWYSIKLNTGEVINI